MNIFLLLPLDWSPLGLAYGLSPYGLMVFYFTILFFWLIVYANVEPRRISEYRMVFRRLYMEAKKT